MDATEIIVEEQFNDGIGNGINEGDRFINSRLGKREELSITSCVRGIGLNDESVKVEGKESIDLATNSCVRNIGLNYKIVNDEKEEKAKLETNSYAHSSGLNSKSTRNAMGMDESPSEVKCKFLKQMLEE